MGRFSVATVLLVLCFFLAHIICCSEASVVDRPMQKRFYSWEEGKRSSSPLGADFESIPLERLFKRRFYAWASQLQNRHALSDPLQL